MECQRRSIRFRAMGVTSALDAARPVFLCLALVGCGLLPARGWAQNPGTGAGTITACRTWRCPSCKTVLRKGALGTRVQPGEPASRIVGTATCGKCLARYSQTSVYGGLYDYQPAVKTLAKGAVAPARVAVVVFALRSTQPPRESVEYCRKILSSRHPQSEMVEHYVIGDPDTLSASECVALYESLAADRRLPNLGDHVDSWSGAGPDGKAVVALFFPAKNASSR
jgi:hypothetical protein